MEENIKLYAEIINNMPIGITVWHLESIDSNKDFKLVVANPIVGKFLGVTVEKVNTMNVRGQLRRYGRFEGYKASWKKAIVTLTADSKTIEFFDGMM